MGFDKLTGFLNKNLQNCIEQIFYNKNSKGVFVANHIFFDINFIIYLCISILEDDINNIIKYILALKYSNKDIIIEN